MILLNWRKKTYLQTRKPLCVQSLNWTGPNCCKIFQQFNVLVSTECRGKKRSLRSIIHYLNMRRVSRDCWLAEKKTRCFNAASYRSNADWVISERARKLDCHPSAIEGRVTLASAAAATVQVERRGRKRIFGIVCCFNGGSLLRVGSHLRASCSLYYCFQPRLAGTMKLGRSRRLE